MIYKRQTGVPAFYAEEYCSRKKEYVLLIPVINEGDRIRRELERAYRHRIFESVDIVVCDGGSTDGSTESGMLRRLRVNTLLVKQDVGGQGAQLRMGIWWSLRRGYRGILTIDGNNKDSIEDVPRFLVKLEKGYDFVQGSRFVKGGRAVRTPLLRLAAIRLVHAPLISLAAGFRFTDTTNAYRAYSAAYLRDRRVQPLRDIFMSYELLAYLSVRAAQTGYRVCEVPVARVYPKSGQVPTKIGFWKGNAGLAKILIRNMLGLYAPE